MSRRRLPVRSLIACMVAATLPLSAVGAGKPAKPPATIGDLKPRTVDIRPDQKVDASAARAMDNYRRYLEQKDADPELRAEALRCDCGREGVRVDPDLAERDH